MNHTQTGVSLEHWSLLITWLWQLQVLRTSYPNWKQHWKMVSLVKEVYNNYYNFPVSWKWSIIMGRKNKNYSSYLPVSSFFFHRAFKTIRWWRSWNRQKQFLNICVCILKSNLLITMMLNRLYCLNKTRLGGISRKRFTLNWKSSNALKRWFFTVMSQE